ncbi:MAG TPA: LysR family transcriptional regulator [Longimicrobium sp.]|nr:LysR family transcriptional regulator [Longimicrobium sp.]
MNDDFNAMAVFVALAETKSFRRAGDRLGVTASAVSHSLRRLEERLGVVLAHRTSRSMHLTQAGELLYASVGPALQEVRDAAAAVGALGSDPRGTLRLHVAGAAESFLSGPVLDGFLAAHPHVRLDVFVSDDPLDIVGSGYDAGVRLGEVIDVDMIAVPLAGDERMLVVGAPSYFARHPRPAHPRDLAHHECLNWHPTADAPAYRWEFTEDGRDFSVAVPNRVLTNHVPLLLRMVRAGRGLTIYFERELRGDIDRGDLEVVLEEYSTPFPGFFLYYPGRRQASPPLRALIDYILSWRRSSRDRPG